MAVAYAQHISLYTSNATKHLAQTTAACLTNLTPPSLTSAVFEAEELHAFDPATCGAACAGADMGI